MSAIDGLLLGFAEATTVQNLLLILLGSFLGTWIGMLPGLGPAAGIAILLPFTYDMNPASALMMLSGIYFGAQYGGSISSILINTPGDASSVMTALDGYPMAKKGRGGAALLISAISSLVGGTLGLIALTFLAIPISRIAISFGPAEYCALMVFALVVTSSLVTSNVSKGLFSLVIGLLFACVGTDLQSGAPRMTFGSDNLLDGIPLTAVIIGLFAIAEALFNVERMVSGDAHRPLKVGKLWATSDEWMRSRWSTLRGSVIGFFVGVLPGAGGSVATILSYAVERRISKHPEQFGKGAVEGVAGPEAANNATVPGAMIPLLSLGVPGSGTTAILLGALLLYGLQPGPRLFVEHPEIAWGLIASLYVSNIMLVVLNVPLIGIFVRMLDLRTEVLTAVIVVVSLTGAYAVTNSLFDVGMAIFFGVVGYLMRKADIPPAPMIMGVVLGGMLEQSARQTLSLSGGSWMVFLERPVAASMLALSLLSLFWPLIQWTLKKRIAPSMQAAAERAADTSNKVA
jgi:putative tricarboxylic transport membrane protein